MADRLFDIAPCGLAVLDGTGQVVQANHEFLRLVDLPRTDLVGARTLSSLLPVSGRILLETHLLPMVEQLGRVSEVALEMVRPGGERVPVMVNLISAPTAEDARSMVVAAFEARDRSRYEDNLLHATRAAEEASRRAADLTDTLQETLIPPRPPAIPHLDISAAYRPAGDGREVGGDFYDVFQVGPEEWFIVLGDVSGKGVAAAVVTSFVRYTLRALTVVHRDPAEVLYLLDRAVTTHPTDRYCTVIVVRLVRVRRHWQLDIALGGHPPALVREVDGRVRELGEPGTPVGLVTTPEFQTVRLDLSDHTVMLYTDGITEARSELGMFGDDRLATLVAHLPPEPAAITDAVMSTALSWQSGHSRDDMAVITLAAHDRGDDPLDDLDA